MKEYFIILAFETNSLKGELRMKIGLLITSIGNFGQKGFYNAQEIGLAKEFGKLVDDVVIYKLIPADQEKKSEMIDNRSNVIIHLIPAKSIGINGFFDVNILSKDLDALIYFSDTQIMVPRVEKWARKNHVAMYPYIGVTESHSNNGVVKMLIDTLFKRNLAVYRKLHCFVKTPDVEKRLRAFGVKQITVMPVGLDMTLMNNNYEQTGVYALKAKYGYQKDNKILLFIGRFVQEKQPERMVEIFHRMYNKDNTYRLIMVGMGELRSSVEGKIRSLKLESVIRIIDQIPNSDIWELYRIAQAFVNLNKQEIFGMAILEAMYYGCKVVAMHAPGPDAIINDKVSGYLVDSNEEAIEMLCLSWDKGHETHEYIVANFSWKSVAQKMHGVIY